MGETTVQSRRATQSMTIYLVTAFGLAWPLWGLAWAASSGRVNLPLIPLIMLGSFAPLFGAIVALGWAGGWSSLERFFWRSLRIDMGYAVFVVSMLLLPALAIIAALINAHLTGRPADIGAPPGHLLLSFVFLFLLGGTLNEEFGWSLLSDLLDLHLPVGRATLILGSIWGFWHLPLFFIIAPHLVQGYTPFHAFLLCAIATRFLFSWAYHRGGRSIMSNMLCHTTMNMCMGSFVAIAPGPDDPSVARFWIFTGLVIVAAGLLWLIAPARTHDDKRSPDTKAAPVFATAVSRFRRW